MLLGRLCSKLVQLQQPMNGFFHHSIPTVGGSAAKILTPAISSSSPLIAQQRQKSNIPRRKQFALKKAQREAAGGEEAEEAAPKETTVSDADKLGFKEPLLLKPNSLEAILKDYGHDAVNREWWKETRTRTHFACTDVRRQYKRRQDFEAYAPLRRCFRTLAYNRIFPVAHNDKAMHELRNLPRQSIKQRNRIRCNVVGARRSCKIEYRLHRITFRDFADHGRLAGVRRACW